MIKFMLAEDWDENKARFPVYAQPKIDGVRAGNLNGTLTGRSLKAHKNRFTTKHFSQPQYLGLDMELAAERETHPDLCRLTTSAVGTIIGEPYVLGHAFDYITPETIHLPYEMRFARMVAHIDAMLAAGYEMRCRVIYLERVWTMERLLELDDKFLAEGYEGTIVRDPAGKYKQGRSTAKEGGLLRIKRFISEEAVVVSITEGNHNANDAQINELGKTFRSSHQENQIPNGMVGSLQCTILKDSTLFKAGQAITVSKGEMTAEMAKDYFDNPSKIIGKVIKFKHFPKGVKNQPRFPTFQTIREASDIE